MNFIHKIVLLERLDTITEYVVRGLHRCTTWVIFDLLRALGVLVYENTGRLTKYHEELLGEHGLLIRLCSSQDENVLRAVIQCIENLTIRSAGLFLLLSLFTYSISCYRTSGFCTEYLGEEYQVRCFNCLLSLLQTPKPNAMESLTHCKVINL